MTIAKVEGENTYTVKVGDVYLYWGEAKKLYGSTTLPEANYKWTIEGAGENGVKMTIAEQDSGNLYFNAGASSKHFRCYVSKVKSDSTLEANYYYMTLFKEVTE